MTIITFKLEINQIKLAIYKLRFRLMAPKPEQSLVGAGAGERIYSCRGLSPVFLGENTPGQRGGDEAFKLL